MSHFLLHYNYLTVTLQILLINTKYNQQTNNIGLLLCYSLKIKVMLTHEYVNNYNSII